LSSYVETSAKILELQRRLEAHGYKLYGVKHFKKFDRVRFGNDEITISLNLRSKISELALDTLIEACIGTLGSPPKHRSKTL
jgi:hypothetical protein